MKNKKLLIGLFLLLSSYLSLSAFEPLLGWPTKEYISLGYSQNLDYEFLEDSKGLYNFGSGRLNVQDYRNKNIGFGATIEIGGLYNLKINNILKNTKSEMKGSDFDHATSFFAGFGAAFDIPVNQTISFNFEVGPCYDWIMLKTKDKLVYDFLIGVYGAATARFLPEKVVNIIIGTEVAYNFLQFGYVKTAYNLSEFKPTTSFLELKPFIGISFKTDSLYHSNKPNNNSNNNNQEIKKDPNRI